MLWNEKNSHFFGRNYNFYKFKSDSGFNTWVRYDQNLNLILIHKQASIFFTPVKDRRF